MASGEAQVHHLAHVARVGDRGQRAAGRLRTRTGTACIPGRGILLQQRGDLRRDLGLRQVDVSEGASWSARVLARSLGVTQ